MDRKALLELIDSVITDGVKLETQNAKAIRTLAENKLAQAIEARKQAATDLRKVSEKTAALQAKVGDLQAELKQVKKREHDAQNRIGNLNTQVISLNGRLEALKDVEKVVTRT